MKMELLELAAVLSSVRTQIQLWHWQTRSFARHMAYGELYDKLDKIDDLVEVLIYLKGGIENEHSTFEQMSFLSESPASANEVLPAVVVMLDELKGEVSGSAQNIIDEITADINRALYKINTLA